MTYTILAYHVDRSSAASCILTVAIQSSATGFKAYRRTVDHYPTEKDVTEAASAGAKVTPEQANRLFADLATAYNYEG